MMHPQRLRNGGQLLATTLTTEINFWKDAFQRKYTKLFVVQFVQRPLFSFRSVTSSTFPEEHLDSSILKTVIKRHGPPIARIVEPLQILLAQFLNRSVVLLF